MDIPAALTPGMTSLIRSKVPNATLFRNLILQGARLNAQDAFAGGLIDKIAPTIEDLLKTSTEIALEWAPKAKAGRVYGYLKQEMYQEAYQNLISGVLRLVSLSTGIPEKSSKL